MAARPDLTDEIEDLRRIQHAHVEEVRRLAEELEERRAELALLGAVGFPRRRIGRGSTALEMPEIEAMRASGELDEIVARMRLE